MTLQDVYAVAFLAVGSVLCGTAASLAEHRDQFRAFRARHKSATNRVARQLVRGLPCPTKVADTQSPPAAAQQPPVGLPVADAFEVNTHATSDSRLLRSCKCGGHSLYAGLMSETLLCTNCDSMLVRVGSQHAWTRVTTRRLWAGQDQVLS